MDILLYKRYFDIKDFDVLMLLFDFSLLLLSLC